MPVIGLRELSRQTGKAVEQLEATGEPIIVTKQGQPIAAIVAVDRNRLHDVVLAAAPEFADSTREADEALAAGNTRSMTEVLADMARDESVADERQHSSGAAREAEALPEPDPTQLVSDYADLAERFSAEMARNALPAADDAAIGALGAASVGLFHELVLLMLPNILERVREVANNAVKIGRERGSVDASLEVFNAVQLSERLSHPRRPSSSHVGEQAEPLLRGIDEVGLLDHDALAAELGLTDGESLTGFGRLEPDLGDLENIGGRRSRRDSGEERVDRDVPTGDQHGSDPV